MKKKGWAKSYTNRTGKIRELNKVLIVDDISETAINNRDNLVLIKPFYFDDKDTELLKLISYLEKIKDESNYRRIDKRNWNQMG